MASHLLLWVLRHAKAEPERPGSQGSDHDRVLTPRGLTQAGELRDLMAARLASGLPVPELILCSSATRTRQTAEKLADALPHAKLRVEPGLYGASPADVVAQLHLCDAGVTGLMVVGHNPTVHTLVWNLTGDERLTAGYATATLATIGFLGVSWGELRDGSGSLEDLWTPSRSSA